MTRQSDDSWPKLHGKTEVEWAWEIHKNCDQLLHQRLASFTAAQAMTLAAFMVLTVARFQPNIPADRIIFVEAGRYVINLFGLILSVFAWLVTFPMVTRLDYLNATVLAPNLPVYRGYLSDALSGFWFRRFYRMIIPLVLPITELLLWLTLLGLMIWADVVTSPIDPAANRLQTGRTDAPAHSPASRPASATPGPSSRPAAPEHND